jgi:hypothetical protein
MPNPLNCFRDAALSIFVIPETPTALSGIATNAGIPKDPAYGAKGAVPG